MYLLCEQYLQKEKGEAHSIQILVVAMEPIQTPAGQQLRLPLQWNQRGGDDPRGSKLLFKCKYLWKEAVEGKEMMKTPVKNGVGTKAHKPPFPSRIVPAPFPAQVGDSLLEVICPVTPNKVLRMEQS